MLADVRISQLRRDFEEKQQKFQESRQALVSDISDKIKITTFLKNNPKTLLTTLVAGATFFTSMKAMGKGLLFLGGTNGTGAKVGFFKNAIQLGTMMAMKSMFPLAKIVFKSLLKRVFGS